MHTGLRVGSSVACYELFSSMARKAAESQPPTLCICLRANCDLWVCFYLCLLLSLPQCSCFYSQLYLSADTLLIYGCFYCHSLSISAVFALPSLTVVVILSIPLFSLNLYRDLGEIPCGGICFIFFLSPPENFHKTQYPHNLLSPSYMIIVIIIFKVEMFKQLLH